MYDKDLKVLAINNLERKVIQLAKQVVDITAQGYVVNGKKECKLNWICILIHSYENIDILTHEQQLVVDELYDKILNL